VRGAVKIFSPFLCKNLQLYIPHITLSKTLPPCQFPQFSITSKQKTQAFQKQTNQPCSRGNLTKELNFSNSFILENPPMNQETAKKVIKILLSADGGCVFCVSELIELFVLQFPEYKTLAGELFKSKFETDIELPEERKHEEIKLLRMG